MLVGCSGLLRLKAQSAEHLSAVVLTFAAAPYSKFTHLFYRFAALLRDNLERLETAERQR